MKSSIRLTILLLFTLCVNSVFAQSTPVVPEADKSTRLDIVQSVLESKLIERKELREAITAAEPDDIADLEAALVEINDEITELRESFEQIAVGSVDLGIFGADDEEFNWRTEMTQVMMPIIRNLQSLTEKPRKIEALRSAISENNNQLETAQEAVIAIDETLSLASSEPTKQALVELQVNWKDQVEEIQRRTEVAKVKLDNLQTSNRSFFDSFKTGILGFVTGRGLTLLLAIVAAAAVWYVVKLITKLLLKKSRGEAAKNFRTRQRLVQYAFNLLTALLMAIVVLVVLYIRGDVLLLGVAFLITGLTVLGLRNVIPKFISEARLLLNLGSIREDERVMYNGVPYKVTQLNMYSILKNPELTGIVRLPLESMMAMISRPAGKEIWFPASKGDFIMTSDGKLLEVIALTTELVQLQSLVGTKSSIPTADFYAMTFDNITRGDSFAIVSTFGIGYVHQGISNDSVPAAFQKSVAAALAQRDFSEHVVSVSVELKEAGGSSLDYWVCVVMASTAVRSYFKIDRIIQQTCVETCSKESWDIPFPQLTIHN